MGVRVSTAHLAGKKRSDAIDMQIEEDMKRLKRECKVLLLGSEESGKSTIMKQMKMIHQDGFTETELAEYKPTIYRNVLESAHSLIMFMKKIGLECEEYSNRVRMEKVLDFKLKEGNDQDIYFPTEIADSIYRLWKDPIISKIMEEHASDFHLMDSAPYFFSEVLRIGAPEYQPTEADVLRARTRTLGVKETRFNMGQLSILICDVGDLRSERRKWIHYFESVTSIMFCTALSEYDHVLLEEKNQNRLAESLHQFESVINSRWLLHKPIILFLNKITLFKHKLVKVPLERYFPEYTGGADTEKAAKYILWKFMQANRAKLSVYPHLLESTDVTNIRLVFSSVKEGILRSAIEASSIL